MRNINLLPCQIVEKKILIYNRMTTALIIFLALLNIALFQLGIKNISCLINMEEEARSEEFAVKSPQSKDNSTVNSMDSFSSDFAEKLEFRSAAIAGRSINFEIPYSGKHDYYRIIGLIEEKNKYRIVSISKSEEGIGGAFLRISLEVIR
jgi:hypothetical protein